MQLYYTSYAPISDRDALAALMPKARRDRLSNNTTNAGALFAYALLAWALDHHYAISAHAHLRYTSKGAPYVPGQLVHLSLSHSHRHALCALAPFPLGCDIQNHRPVSARLHHRLLAKTECSADFFTHWALKESYIKLNGEKNVPFSELAFTCAGEGAKGPGVHGWVYRNIPHCTVALVAKAPFSRPKLEEIPSQTLFAYAANVAFCNRL